MHEIGADARRELVNRLDRLVDPVHVLVFPQASCPHCDDVVARVRELAALSSRIVVEVVDVERKPLLAACYGVAMTPAIAVLRGGVAVGDTLIRYFGTPDDATLDDLVDDLVEVSRDEPDLTPPVAAWLATLDRPLYVHAFLSGTGARRPAAMHDIHRLAVASPWLGAATLVADDYPELAGRHDVGSASIFLIDDSVVVPADSSHERVVEALMAATRRP